MKYLPLTEKEKSEIIKEIGLQSPADLFQTIPEDVKENTTDRLPAPYSEIEIRRYFQEEYEPGIRRSFMGGNGHTHYIPSVIDPLISRGEFLTAYTPYQPEVSQGTLQAMFEYQSMMAELMGVEVSNASLYDGSTAMAEACLMAARVTKKNHIIVSDMVHPEYTETLNTYAAGNVLSWSTTGHDEKGRIDLEGLSKELQKHGSITGAVVVQSPNYYGIIENLKNVKDLIKDKKILLIVVVTEAMSLPLLQSPGSQGADIVCGEGQSFGIPLSAGGPWLGFIGTSMSYVRNLPGRIVGESVDSDNRRAYVITLAAREQHIRREKATSNICTNQGLMALRCAIYLSTMGKAGTRRAAERSARFTEYARRLISKQEDIKIIHQDSPVFNEFVIETPVNAQTVFNRCVTAYRIAPGTVIGENMLLCSFNETLLSEDIEGWAQSIIEACSAG